MHGFRRSEKHHHVHIVRVRIMKARWDCEFLVLGHKGVDQKNSYRDTYIWSVFFLSMSLIVAWLPIRILGRRAVNCTYILVDYFALEISKTISSC
jgi:hypothetical protein